MHRNKQHIQELINTHSSLHLLLILQYKLELTYTAMVSSHHVLTDICWISLLELGMSKALVMHACPAGLLWSCNGNGINISSCNSWKKYIDTHKDLYTQNTYLFDLQYLN